MATALPTSSSFTGGAVTEADFKAAITSLRDYLSGLFGTDGATATALLTMGAPLSASVSKTTTYSIAAADKGYLIDCTGTWTLGALAAATAGAGFTVGVKNSGSGVITFDPNLSELVDGGSTLIINAGESMVMYCTGTGWLTVGKSSSTPIGAVMPYAGSAAPTGWLLCYGQAVSRTTYASLFSAISTTYGVGDGSTTFNLPDLRGRVPAGVDNMGGSSASRITSGGSGITGSTLGAAGGSETHTLTTAQMPSHNHPGSTASSPYGTAPNTAVSGSDVIGVSSLAVSVTVAAQGGGGAHQNTQPTMMLNYIIKT